MTRQVPIRALVYGLSVCFVVLPVRSVRWGPIRLRAANPKTDPRFPKVVQRRCTRSGNRRPICHRDAVQTARTFGPCAAVQWPLPGEQLPFSLRLGPPRRRSIDEIIAACRLILWRRTLRFACSPFENFINLAVSRAGTHQPRGERPMQVVRGLALRNHCLCPRTHHSHCKAARRAVPSRRIPALTNS